MEEKEIEIIESDTGEGKTKNNNVIKVLKSRKERRADLKKNGIHPTKEEKRVGVNFSKLLSRRERRAEAKLNKVDFVPQFNGGVAIRVKTKAEIKIIMNQIARENKIQARGAID